jgi:leader peptidase (prepilin peptidase)/N-methyltransferase
MLSDPLLRLALGATAGLLLGSFIGALTWRWPRDISIARGRSCCDSCGVPLSPLDLVPLLGRLLQQGRCRHCGARIPLRHTGIEIAAALVAGLALWLVPGLPGLALAAFGLLLLALAILDAEHFWLPDALTLPLLALGLAFGPPPLADRLWGAALGFASLWFIAQAYRRLRGREGMGGGDPRLLAAIGAWMGWMMLPFVLLAASLFGLAFAALDRLLGRPVAADTALPLGTLMALAAWPLALVQFAG